MQPNAYERVRASFNEDAARVYPLERFSQPASSVRLMQQAFAEGRRRLGDVARAHVIEAGCGNGYWLAELASWPPWRELSLQLEGFDLSDELIRLAGRRHNPPNARFHFVTGNVLDYRPSAPADVVFCFDVIQHVPAGDRRAAMANLLAMTRPGGLVLIADNHKWAMRAMYNNLLKWLAGHTPIRCIPPHYLLASYPSFRWLIATMRGLGAEPIAPPLRAEEGAPKRAAIFRKPT
jgi:SAM-dependent methyltransferase